MSSRQMVQGILLAVGLSILFLFMIPVVHVPCVVIHGPATVLRAQRAAWLFDFLLRAAAFLFVGMLLPLLCQPALFRRISLPISELGDLSLNCALRC